MADILGSWVCVANQWFLLPWSNCPAWADIHISVKELVISCSILGPEMARCHIRSMCDNATVVIIIKQAYKLQHNCNACLFFIGSRCEITLTTKHVACSRNRVADALSKRSVTNFFQEVLYAYKAPSAIIPPVMEILIDRRPQLTGPEVFKLVCKLYVCLKHSP